MLVTSVELPLIPCSNTRPASKFPPMTKPATPPMSRQDSNRNLRLRRRQLLKMTAGSAAAMLLNHSALAKTSGAAKPIKSCIVVMLYGGPSHLDTWDMKPRAPREVRGEYQAISTSVPGRFVCEHLPQCAKIVHRLNVIRSLHHTMGNHNSAMYQALVGRLPKIDLDILGADRTTDFPSLGCAVSYMTSAGKLPKTGSPLVNVALPHVMHNVVDLAGQNSGFLLGKYDPLQITTDPNQPQFQVPNLSLPEGIPLPRMTDRLGLRGTLENQRGKGGDAGFDDYQNRALELIQSDEVHKAFRIENESDKTRDRYGRTTLGQSLLLARKLVESGVRFINVNDKVINGQDANWDSHANIFPRHKELLAPFDQGFSALIEDLQERGLLDETLVLVMGEFGRTPRVNASAGRDHWPNCYCAVMAGGGVRAGATFGESDREGAYPASDGVTPADMTATLLSRFGIDPKAEILDPLGRPLPLSEGTVSRGLFT